MHSPLRVGFVCSRRATRKGEYQHILQPENLLPLFHAAVIYAFTDTKHHTEEPHSGIAHVHVFQRRWIC